MEATMSQWAAMESLLDLGEFEVVDGVSDHKTRRWSLTIVPKVSVGVCPHCHHASGERHDGDDRAVVDLPLGGWRTELIVRLWQFHCSRCDRYFTPRYAALAEGAHATERLLERMAELAGRSDICTAAQFFGLPEKTVEGWYYDYVERQRRQPRRQLQPVRSLGIDELSLKKSTANSVPC